MPVKPPLGVTVIVEVPFAPGDGMLAGELARVKPGTFVAAPTGTAIDGSSPEPAASSTSRLTR